MTQFEEIMNRLTRIDFRIGAKGGRRTELPNDPG